MRQTSVQPQEQTKPCPTHTPSTNLANIPSVERSHTRKPYTLFLLCVKSPHRQSQAMVSEIWTVDGHHSRRSSDQRVQAVTWGLFLVSVLAPEYVQCGRTPEAALHTSHLSASLCVWYTPPDSRKSASSPAQSISLILLLLNGQHCPWRRRRIPFHRSARWDWGGDHTLR